MFPINRFPRQAFPTKQSRREEDIEHGRRRRTLPDITVEQTEPSNNASNNRRETFAGSEPTAPTPVFYNSPSGPNEYRMTKAYSGGRPSDPDTIDTTIKRRPSSVESREGKARRRFISKFFKKEEKDSEDDLERRRPRPWYKGKALPHEPFTVRNQLERTVLNSWLNILLLLVPVGFVLNYVHANPIAVFFVNFAAILPLAGTLGNAMDELRLRTGDVLGALVYMTFGNIVQSITCIFLLRSRQISTLKTSLIGGILTLILLNNGIAFFFGGLRRIQQYYNTTVATVFNGLLSVSIAAFVIPTASYYLSATAIPVITKQSRGMAFVLMAVYGLYLYFELITHADAFNEESQKVPMRPRKRKLPHGAIAESLVKAGGLGAGPGRVQLAEKRVNDELINIAAYEEEDEDEEEAQLHASVCIITLVIGTTILAFNTQFMTDSIQGLTEKAGVPRDFIGMVLLPILSNDAMAIQCAVKDQMDLAIHSSLGKSLQTALVVAPILVVVGWGMRIEDMNLLFDGFQVASLFVSVLLAQQCILDGTSNWLKGAILTLTYIIIAIASWFQGTTSVVTVIA